MTNKRLEKEREFQRMSEIHEELEEFEDIKYRRRLTINEKKKYDELSNELYKSCCRYDSIREGFFSRIKNGDHPIATTIAYCCVVIMILGLGIACFGHIGIGMIVSGIGAVIGLSAAFVSGEGDDGNTW